ncbi:MAG: hypothetical protein BWX68_02706 [Verrucomicrobia bacterium ADurb.Bin063]|nr:MAG: hypothetical protein BWX68_02706 [Verrucomicrobia bacterium ADurb.Bin063]
MPPAHRLAPCAAASSEPVAVTVKHSFSAYPGVIF